MKRQVYQTTAGRSMHAQNKGWSLTPKNIYYFTVLLRKDICELCEDIGELCEDIGELCEEEFFDPSDTAGI